MANHQSAKKRIRRNATRYGINHSRLSSIRTAVKKVELALQDGNLEAAKEAFQKAEPLLMRGVNRGVLHRNTASRKVSRLSANIKKLSA